MNLNERQKEAVLCVDGPMLIVAGAGSGKTRVITCKISHLLSIGLAKPSEITAVTFTNKATQEMRERIFNTTSSMFSIEEIQHITISTFHSFCAKVLRGSIDKLKYSRDFVIYDGADQKSLILRLLEKHNLKEYSPKEVAHIFSSVKNGLSKIFNSSDLFPVFEDYEKELKNSNALDFVDLLKYTFELFKNHKEVLEYYQERAKYLFVDEYQDTNKLQYNIIKLLASKYKNICVVGDEDQSIYKWRGADINNILDFEKDYKNAKIIKLEQNYRSTGNIIGASSSLISKNTMRKDKKLFTNKDKGEKVKIYSAINDLLETEFIGNEIKKAVDKNYKYKDIAIFYRTNAQSRILEDNLRKNSIPYTIIGGVRFYDRKEIRDLISYLKLCLNKNDNNALIRILNVPSRGIGKKTLGKLIDLASENKTSLYEVMLNIKDEFSASITEKIKDLTAIIESASKIEKGSDVLRHIIDKTFYIDFIKSKKEDHEERVNNILELVNAMVDYEENNLKNDLFSFLESVALISDTDIEKGSGGVSLMTLHSAKGLEFPVVFIHGVEEGLIPYVRYGESFATDIEEERRLLYVGMTRSKEKLFLTLAKNRRAFGTIKSRNESSFLSEIDNIFLDFIDDRSHYYDNYKNLEKIPKNDYKYINDEKSKDENSSLLGKKIEHATYGKGIVRALEGKGDKAKVTICFDRYGVKKLILGYANLIVY